ncbi:HAD-IA family hydrolase [Salininema proteolyticum]|uniref:HAD-IA family hydrolase n=2 Tax=Salininema proteolyticum TaxID=1607685 RepID=A0ABV8U235_9ACTN
MRADFPFHVSAVLFDLDGTLVNSTAAVDRHTRLWADRCGLDPEWTIAATRGIADEEFIPRLVPHRDPEAELAWLTALSCRDTEGIRPVPGADRTLDRLPPRRWGVVTAAARTVAAARIAAAGLPEPPLLLTAEDVGSGKPDPEGYLKGAAALGVPPADCLVFEDSPTGRRAGADAGMTVVAVGAPPHDMEVPHLRDFTEAAVSTSADGRLVLARRHRRGSRI